MTVQLSPRFTLDDLCRSTSATRFGIENVPGPHEIEALQALCANVLEPLVSHYGALHMESGFRCIALNKKIGGAQNSQHTLGEAADIVVRGVAHADLTRWIRDNLPFDQLILEFVDPKVPGSGWVHVSFSKTKQRKQVLEAVKLPSGKTEYRPWPG